MALKNLFDSIQDKIKGIGPEQQQQRAQMIEALDRDDYGLAKAIETAAPGTAGLLNDKNSKKAVMQTVISGSREAKKALMLNESAFAAATSDETTENVELKLEAAAEIAKDQADIVARAQGIEGKIANDDLQRSGRLCKEAIMMAGRMEDVPLAAKAIEQRADLQQECHGGDPKAAKDMTQSYLADFDHTDPVKRTLGTAAIVAGASADALSVDGKIALLKATDAKVKRDALNALGADKVARDDCYKAIVAIAKTAEDATSPEIAETALKQLVDPDGGPESYAVLANSYHTNFPIAPEAVETVISALGNTLNNHPQIVEKVLPDWQATERTLEDINRFYGNEHQKAHGDKRLSEDRKDHMKAVYGKELAADMIAKNDEGIPPLPEKVTISKVIGDEMGPASGLRLYFAKQIQDEVEKNHGQSVDRPRPEHVALTAEAARLNGQVIEDTLVSDRERQQAQRNLEGIVRLEDAQTAKANAAYVDVAADVATTVYYPDDAEQALRKSVEQGSYTHAKTITAPFANANAGFMPDKHLQEHKENLQASLKAAHEAGVKADLGKARAEIDRLSVSPEGVARGVAATIADDLRQQSSAPAIAYAATVLTPGVIVPQAIGNGRR